MATTTTATTGAAAEAAAPAAAAATTTNATTSTTSKEKAKAIEVDTRWPDMIESFDNKEMSDAEVAVDGMPEPLKVSKAVLERASDFFASAFQEGNSHTVVWTVDTTAKEDCNALTKALRYCYGENLRVKPEEAIPVYVAMKRLKLKDEGYATDKLEAEAVELAKKDVAAGASMLKNCCQYEECRQKGASEALIDKLARVVLTEQSLSCCFDSVLGCLLCLPPVWLSKIKYGAPLTAQSEAAVRIRYVQHHANDLSKEEQKRLLLPLKNKTLSSCEAEYLRETKLFSDEEIVELLMSSLKGMEKQKQEEQRRMEQRLRSAALLRMCANSELTEDQQKFVHELGNTRSRNTYTELAHVSCKSGGAVCDDKRKLIMSTNAELDHGSTLQVIKLSTALRGTTTTKSLPFPTEMHTPVYDGTQFVYFMESSGAGIASGTRFCRYDLDSDKVEELPPMPFLFGSDFSGCWHRGCVYAIDADYQLCCYDVDAREWRKLDAKVPKAACGQGRLLANPHDPEYLYVYQGRLYKICIALGTSVRIADPPEEYGSLRDALLLGMEGTTEVVLIASMPSNAWYMYSSYNGQWTRLDKWYRSQSVHDRQCLVHMPSWNMLYYQIHGVMAWECVELPAL